MIDYSSSNYDDEKRWMSYFYQVKEVLSFKPENVLIIGKGNGLVAEYLKMQGVRTIALDIDKSLNPDVAASVLNMPFADKEFNVVLCAQVLEHLPYEDFPKALLEIKRVVRSSVVISLPHFGPAIKFCLKLPLFPPTKFMIKLPYPKRHVFKGEHHWEIGKKGYPERKIKFAMENAGFTIDKDYIVFENPLHHFFILKKI